MAAAKDEHEDGDGARAGSLTREQVYLSSFPPQPPSLPRYNAQTQAPLQHSNFIQNNKRMSWRIPAVGTPQLLTSMRITSVDQGCEGTGRLTASDYVDASDVMRPLPVFLAFLLPCHHLDKLCSS